LKSSYNITTHSCNGNGGNGNGGNGNGNGPPPFLISGAEITVLTNHDNELDEIAAQLVRGEAQLVWPTVPQTAAITVLPMQRVYVALHQTPIRGNGLKANAAKTNGKLDAFVRANLLEVWDSIERVTA
jgi:hypothetical protein